jgi:8-oxo-dGTP pyrophosphatase MutT (NUDIX family)
MKPEFVRPIAICVFRKDDSIFAFEGYDTPTDQIFYRPLGGSIEFGELSAQTIVRELREEIGAEILNLCYLGTLENIFSHEGARGHEIVQVYAADFADPAFHARDSLIGFEDNGMPFTARWVPLADFRAGTYPLYPNGLLELLDQ